MTENASIQDSLFMINCLILDCVQLMSNSASLFKRARDVREIKDDIANKQKD